MSGRCEGKDVREKYPEHMGMHSVGLAGKLDGEEGLERKEGGKG